MGDYFQHWLNMGKKTSKKNLPKIFQVNWFEQDKKGKYIWPGFGENVRVLKWIFEMTENKPNISKPTPIGLIPSEGALDISNLKISKEDMDHLFEIDPIEWTREIEDLTVYFHKTFGNHWPKDLEVELDKIKERFTKLKSKL